MSDQFDFGLPSIEGSLIPHQVLDVDGRVTHVNKAWECLFGIEKSLVNGQPFQALLNERTKSSFQSLSLKFKSDTSLEPEVFEIVNCLTGRVVPFQLRLLSVKEHDDKIISSLWIVVEIVSEVSQLQHMAYQELIKKSPVPMAINTNEVEPRITYLNESFVNTFGYTQQDIPTVSSWIKHAYPDVAYREKMMSQWHKELSAARENQGISTSIKFEVVCKDGSQKIVSISGAVVGDFTLVTLVDMTDIHAAQELALRSQELENDHRISQIINYDALTRLPNRELMKSLIENALSSAVSSRTQVALICLDLDEFKLINETFGRNAGDHVLESIARRTQAALREQDTVARLSGDEFVLILSDVPDQDWLERYCQRLMVILSESIAFNEYSIRVSISLGLAVYPEHGMDGESLLLNAETALANAKELGKNNFLMFKPGMKVAIDRYAELSIKLQYALENNEFILHYQPQIDIETGVVTSVEALIRWQSASYGLQYPDTFISVAESSGLIVPIGEWVLYEACKQARQWELQALPIGSVSVNLSSIQFARGNLGQLVAKILKETGLSPKMLVLELTESILMHEEDMVMHAIDELRALGVRLSIDDFGTGYASMTYLKRFEVDHLKIDKSFVMAMTKSEEDQSIVRCVVDLAASLNIASIAEGVEDEETLSMLMEMGCDQAQGYFFSKPVPPSEIEAYFI